MGPAFPEIFSRTRHTGQGPGLSAWWQTAQFREYLWYSVRIFHCHKIETILWSFLMQLGPCSFLFLWLYVSTDGGWGDFFLYVNWWCSELFFYSARIFLKYTMCRNMNWKTVWKYPVKLISYLPIMHQLCIYIWYISIYTYMSYTYIFPREMGNRKVQTCSQPFFS